jgi:hypothetical protein
MQPEGHNQRGQSGFLNVRSLDLAKPLTCRGNRVMVIRMNCHGLVRRIWFLVLSCAIIGVRSEVPIATQDGRIADALEAHMTFLADDLLEGRAAGSAGYELAALYVATRFREFGLKPGGESDQWLQSVPLMESQRVAEGTRFEVTSEAGTEVLDYSVDYLASPHFTETEATVSAPLVFVGFGVHAPEQGYDDFAGVDLRGKIAVVLSKAPPKFPATRLAHFSHPREKTKALVERGAVGVISVPTPKDLEEMPWPRRVIQSQFPAMRWTLTNGSPSDVYPQSKASMTVSPAGIGKLFARSPKPFPAILAAAARSEVQSFPMNLTATLSTKSIHRRVTSPNVIGVLPGSDPKLRGEAVVLTAHLDHQGRGPAVNGDGIYNGAYDNAIGIGMMLEVARVLANREPRPRQSVVFAAVTAEERGLLGSDYLANHFPVAAGRPVANLNLDMVLVTAPTRNFVVLGVEHSSLREPVERAAARLGIVLKPDPQPERVTFIRSDQYSFVRRGVPAIFPKAAADTNGLPSAAITPDVFLKQYYHQPGDDLSLPRDAESAVRFIRFIEDVAGQVADTEAAPQWNPGDFFGEMFGKRGAR